MAASILQIGNSRNVNCDNMVGFPKSGHNLHVNYNVEQLFHSGKKCVKMFQNMLCRAVPWNNDNLL